jgi:Alpha/beta hydrolase domain
MNSDADALAQAGYGETEWLISGQASRYRVPAGIREDGTAYAAADSSGAFGAPAAATAPASNQTPGETDTRPNAQWLGSGHPYATRLLVRRPLEPARFNGSVVVEWLNVSTGQDLDFVYAATRELLVRAGYAWVGVSAQRVGVERLVAWNPARYNTLSVAAPSADPSTGQSLDPVHAPTGAAGGDVLCWDIFSQVAQALRGAAQQVFGVPELQRLVAVGESQAAFRLTRYYNSLQPLHGAYDGFLLYDRAGPGPLRGDVKTRLISIGTEFMVAHLGGPSPADTEHHRSWELAGASHVSLAEMLGYIDPQVRRDAGMRSNEQVCSLTDVLLQGGPSESDPPPDPLWSTVPNGDLMKAALQALTRWVAEGLAPPSAPRLVVDTQGQLLRDAEGRVQGGIRCAAYEAPTAHNLGVTDSGPRLAGSHRDFTAQEMLRRYGSAAAYEARVQGVVQANVAQGFLLAEDAARVLSQAREVAQTLLPTNAIV